MKEQPLLFKKQSKIPFLRSLEAVVGSFSITEKFIFYIFSAALAISSITLLSYVNEYFLVSVPAKGGTLTEGVIGYARFINPILSYTDGGKDLTALIYSGLLKATPDGTLVNDLAKDYTVSDDRLTYTFTLKDNLYFHDGKPVTTDDIVFTIKKATDPSLKSPERVKWEGVTVEKVDAKTIRFILKNPYTPFLENMTLGILPKHIWQDAGLEEFTFSQFNTEPIGSGPYKIVKVNKNAEGLPISYKLEAFSKYALGSPKVQNIVIKFYQSESELLDAYNSGEIESMNAISGEQASLIKKDSAQIGTEPLPRIFGVFFNQSQSAVLSFKEVRDALNLSVDRQEIIDKVLFGYGTPIDGPFPVGSIPSVQASTTPIQENIDARIERAKKILTDAGWKQDESGIFQKKTKAGVTIPLEFSISTSNTGELAKTAEVLKEEWAKIGANVTVKIFEQGDFNQTILRPRKYDALLFGEIIGRDLDLYAFWHSGERNDPGLNIAMYANSKVDKALSEARTSTDSDNRIAQLRTIESEIAKDVPAIFIYSPDYIYVLPQKIKNFRMGKVVEPDERFESVQDWYINEDRVWKIFNK